MRDLLPVIGLSKADGGPPLPLITIVDVGALTILDKAGEQDCLLWGPGGLITRYPGGPFPKEPISFE